MNNEQENHMGRTEEKDQIILNCYLADDDIMENRLDELGEYNVPRYLASFNKRIEPLLVVFSPDIRDEILIDNPEDRPFFTKKQSELVRGYPRKEGDQDYLDEVLTLSQTEIDFWNSVNINPFYMYRSNNRSSRRSIC